MLSLRLYQARLLCKSVQGNGTRSLGPFEIVFFEILIYFKIFVIDFCQRIRPNGATRVIKLIILNDSRPGGLTTIDRD